jgi:hypothetical protein
MSSGKKITWITVLSGIFILTCFYFYLPLQRHSPHHTWDQPFPAINWSAVNAQAPLVIPVDYKGPEAPLPKADIVIMTWTEAEWSALDHVFLHSATSQTPLSKKLTADWHLYSREAPVSSSHDKLWGYYQLVQIKGVSKNYRVLLLRSNVHLAHPPYIEGLNSLLTHIKDEVQPERIYSLSTSGAGNTSQQLGDVIATHSGRLEVNKTENKGIDYNQQNFSCKPVATDKQLLSEVQTKLFVVPSHLINGAVLHKIFKYAARNSEEHGNGVLPLAAEAQIDDMLDPKKIIAPQILLENKPVLSVDWFYVNMEDSPYSAIEMDDAVIIRFAQKNNIACGLLLNISNPIVPANTPDGAVLNNTQRITLSSAIYTQFAPYTSLNGALAVWAMIAGS